jgi:hypothetical protein
LDGGDVFCCAIVERKVVKVCDIKVCAICADLIRARWVGCPFLVGAAAGAATHRLAGQQQPKTEIEIVGDGVFVEAPRRVNGLAQQQLTIAPQLADAPMGPALGAGSGSALLEIPARTSGESRPEEVQLYEQL